MNDRERDRITAYHREIRKATRVLINDLAAELQSFPPGQPLDAATWEDWWTRLLRIAQEA